MTKSDDELKGMPEEIWVSVRSYYGTETFLTSRNEQKRHYAIPRTKYVRADLAPTSQWQKCPNCENGMLTKCAETATVK